MKTNTDLIRVSKKAEKIVFSITDNAKAGISNQFQYTVILINGVTYEANSYAKVQKFISVSSKNAEAITAEHIAQLDAERAEIDAKIEAEQKAERERAAEVQGAKREAVRKGLEAEVIRKKEQVALDSAAAVIAKNKGEANPLTQADVDEAHEVDRKRELKRKRDARYRANNREAIRQRDAEYRKKKAAARAAAKGAKQ